MVFTVFVVLTSFEEKKNNRFRIQARRHHDFKTKHRVMKSCCAVYGLFGPELSVFYFKNAQIVILV